MAQRMLTVLVRFTAKPWMIRGESMSSWCQRVYSFATELHDLSQIAANTAMVSVRISTIPLRLRYELGHAQ